MRRHEITQHWHGTRMLAATMVGLVAALVPALARSPAASASPQSTVADGGHPALPAGTDPTTLSATSLASYGLPSRPPRTSPKYHGWYTAMKAIRYAVNGSAAVTKVPSDAPAPPSLKVTAYTNPGYSNPEPWGGVVDSDQNQYYGVQGIWNVPSPFANDGQTRVAVQWVGVGGAYGSSGGQLVQAGSMVETYSGGAAYFSWFEVYPDQPSLHTTPLGVSPGDTMYVDISTSSSQSYVFLENETTGAYYTVPSGDTAAGCTCPSAEAVNEDPGNGAGGSYLMAFTNPVNFNGVSSTLSGGDEYINSIPWFALVATDSSGNELAVPVNLSGPGDFTVNRTGND